MELERNIATSFVSSRLPPRLPISPCRTFILVLTVAVNDGFYFPLRNWEQHTHVREQEGNHTATGCEM
jgi:hypothetical protein